MSYCFGVDVGGTSVKIGLFDGEGQIVDKWEINTRTMNKGEDILPDIAASLDEKLGEHSISIDDVEGVGIALPGPVIDESVVTRCVNLGWDRKDVAEEFKELFHGKKVKALNDANAAALGEAIEGGGKGCDDSVMLTLGTGVGGGIVINNKIIEGACGGGGEVGHMIVNYDETESCNCGHKGCLEQYTSATGVVNLAKKYMSEHPDTKMHEIGDAIMCHEVFELAKNGDEGAKVVVDAMAKYLGKGMANIAAVVNPEVFIIGGGVSNAGEFLTEQVEKYYREYALTECADAKIVLATLGNDAGIVGARAAIKE
ncbi:MAG: ROK family glucokinase [Eubacterium sp.]|nr:ROK family glucokinase [Eubacterium sp.]